MRAIKRTVLGILVAMLFPVIAMAGYEGIYSGTISGGDSGTWILQVSYDGSARMALYSTKYHVMTGGYGSVRSDGYITASSVTSNASASGWIHQDGVVSGAWSGNGVSGTLFGWKQASMGQYAGTYSGTVPSTAGSATWTMDIFPSGDVIVYLEDPASGDYFLSGAVNDQGVVFVGEEITGAGMASMMISGNDVQGVAFDPYGYYLASFTGTKHSGLSKTEVSQLYVAIFNRASEGGGNQFWRQQGDVVTVANAMLDTQAAKDYFGTSLDTDQAFIEHIYLNTLNKTISEDPGGIAYWVGLLSSGLSRGEVVATLVGVIGEYGPNGLYYDPSSPLTIAAYNQFMNRVEVSNYMADKVGNPPHNWQVSASFSHGLSVTDNPVSVSLAKQVIDSMR